MATQRLYLGEVPVKMAQVGNSMSTYYSYWPEKKILEIYWKERVVTRCRALPGDAFVVICNGGEPIVNKLGIPYRKVDIIAWLLSYYQQSRAYTLEGYENLMKTRRKSFWWWGYEDWEIRGENYIFALCNRQDCGGVFHIACYVNPKITKKEMIELFNHFERGFYYPSYFVKEILKKRLNFTDAEIAQIKAL